MSFPSSAFAATACSNCGSTNTRAAAIQVQYDKLLRVCPNDGWHTDWMDTWQNYEGIKCNTCGYEKTTKYIGLSYTSKCNAAGGWTYNVSNAYTAHAGYDIHQSYQYWVNGSRY